jgi:hypothetical protein
MLLTEANVMAKPINGTIRRGRGIKDRSIVWAKDQATVNPPKTPLTFDELIAFDWKVYGEDGKEVPYAPTTEQMKSAAAANSPRALASDK